MSQAFSARQAGPLLQGAGDPVLEGFATAGGRQRRDPAVSPLDRTTLGMRLGPLPAWDRPIPAKRTRGPGGGTLTEGSPAASGTYAHASSFARAREAGQQRPLEMSRSVMIYDDTLDYNCRQPWP